MKDRRRFLKMAPAVIIPAAALAPASGVALAAGDGSVADFTGTWNTIHSLPFPPGQFREFLALSEGGVLQETNSFLHTASNVDFSSFGLPNVVNASDGLGNWTRVSNGVIQLVFRKLLFDGSRQNFADLLVTGEYQSNGTSLSGTAHVVVVDPVTNKLILDFGYATSAGPRLT